MAEKEHVFAINADDTFLHVGRIDELLRHFKVTNQERRRYILETFEFYDSTGTRMDIVSAEDGTQRLEAKEQAPEDQTVLRDRIASALATIQVRLDRSDKPGAKGTRVPRIFEADIATILAGLGVVYGPLADPNAPQNTDQGTAIHNDSGPH